MARIQLITLLLLLFVGLTSQAQSKSTQAFKYQIKSSLGVSESCEDEGKNQLSQVRIYISQKDLQSSQDFIPAQVRVSACIWGGSYVKDTYELKLPRFMFATAIEKEGVFNLNAEYSLNKIGIEKLGGTSWKVRYFRNTTAWDQIDPIELTLTKNKNRTYPEKIRFYIVKKSKWIEANLRLIE